MQERARALVEHYHQTYELAFRLWDKRNKAFLYLIATLCVASLFTYDPQGSLRSASNAAAVAAQQDGSTEGRNVFMFTLACFASDKCKDVSLEDLKRQFPYPIFNGAISVLVFYLMMNMFAHSNNISRYYAYIVEMEAVIQKELELSDGVAFTREGKFAKEWGSPLGGAVGYFYWMILGGMLIVYFAVRILDEIGQPTLWAHVVIAVLTGVLFLGYVYNSLGLGRPRQAAKSGA